MIIRLAEAADVSTMQQIEVDAGRRFRDVGLASIADDSPPPDVELLGHIESGTAWLAVEAGDRVLGYATASVVDGEGHLDQVSVIEAAAGRRVGARLIEQVCGWARSRGFEAVTLTTFRDVAWNGPYYERLGFRALADEQLGSELAAIRRAERDAGLDLSPRIAMSRELLMDEVSIASRTSEDR